MPDLGGRQDVGERQALLGEEVVQGGLSSGTRRARAAGGPGRAPAAWLHAPMGGGNAREQAARTLRQTGVLLPRPKRGPIRKLSPHAAAPTGEWKFSQGGWHGAE